MGAVDSAQGGKLDHWPGDHLRPGNWQVLNRQPRRGRFDLDEEGIGRPEGAGDRRLGGDLGSSRLSDRSRSQARDRSVSGTSTGNGAWSSALMTGPALTTAEMRHR